MTLQEAKAKELVDKYHYQINLEHNNGFTFELAKACALIAVNEIKKAIAEYSDYDLSKEGQSAMWATLNHLEQVKEAINKL